MTSVTEDNIREFKELCKRNLTPPKAASRFACMVQLDKAIQNQRGAYTENLRNEWLSILYTCLAAPNCYFFDTSLGKQEKWAHKYICNQISLFSELERERTNERAMYTYIACVREYYERARNYSSKKENKNPYAAGLRKSIEQALETRMKENPSLRNVAEDYQLTLRRIFVDEQKLLNVPIFFLFLPYYVFFELAKCENLVEKSTNAFTRITIGKNKPRWSIRNTPFIKAEIDPNPIRSLYLLVEKALCEGLQKHKYSSIGRSLWLTNYEIQRTYPNSDNFSEEKIQDLLIKNAFDFSVPFWSYDAWSCIFCNKFDKYKIDQNNLEMDIHKLLSLEFRGSKQAATGQGKILRKYEKHTVALRKHEFILSELLAGLCSVYHLHSFEEGSSEYKELSARIEKLTGFMIACEKLSLSTIDEPTEYQKLYLVQTGLPYGAFEKKPKDLFDEIDRYLRRPSRILFSAAFMRWNMDLLEKPRRYILTDTVPYSSLLEKLSDALYHALCSEEEVIRDIQVWGGLRISLDDDYVSSMAQASHVWSVWHPQESNDYQALGQHLRNHSDILDKIAEGPDVTLTGKGIVKLKKLDLSDYDFDKQLTTKLVEPKKWILNCLGPFGERFGKPERLTDFRYAMILYTVFQALRDRMCAQAYEICSKILDNHLDPPLMYNREAFEAMLN